MSKKIYTLNWRLAIVALKRLSPTVNLNLFTKSSRDICFVCTKSAWYIREMSSIKTDRGIQRNYFTYLQLFIVCVDKLHITGRNQASDSSKKHWKRHPRGFWNLGASSRFSLRYQQSKICWIMLYIGNKAKYYRI